ncbi:MAG: hypothetical protein RDV48_17570 [Candidatus Eremiobacteraeota bacterium]|nr:hypothetical protein [Candidatus Eremiobacteraeota bacterium]
MKKYLTAVFLVVILATALAAETASAQGPSLKEIFNLKQKALHSQNLDELGKYISKDQLSELRGAKDPKAMLFLMDYLCPQEYELGKEEVIGSRAKVSIKGKARNTKSEGKIEPFTGEVIFIKDGSSWKIQQETKNFQEK